VNALNSRLAPTADGRVVRVFILFEVFVGGKTEVMEGWARSLRGGALLILSCVENISGDSEGMRSVTAGVEKYFNSAKIRSSFWPFQGARGLYERKANQWGGQRARQMSDKQIRNADISARPQLASEVAPQSERRRIVIGFEWEKGCVFLSVMADFWEFRSSHESSSVNDPLFHPKVCVSEIVGGCEVNAQS